MGGIEFNKIFAAILVAGIVAMMTGFFAEVFVHPKELDENAYKIEGVETAEITTEIDLPDPILALLAEADVSRGQKISKACAACHSFEKGGANGVGPNLYSVVGRTKESVEGYNYSGALSAVGGDTWTYAELNKYLWKPKKYAPGTKMNYIGLRKPEDRAAIIAWLRTLSDDPAPMPGAADIAAEQAELAPEPEASAEEVLDDELSTSGPGDALSEPPAGAIEDFSEEGEAADGEEENTGDVEQAVETLEEGDPGDVTMELEDEDLQDASDTIVDTVNEAQGENVDLRSNPTLEEN